MSNYRKTLAENAMRAGFLDGRKLGKDGKPLPLDRDRFDVPPNPRKPKRGRRR